MDHNNKNSNNRQTVGPLGCTLVTDLGTSSVDEMGVANWSAVTSHSDYPTRVMVAGSVFATALPPEDIARRIVQLRDNPPNDKLRFGIS